MDNDQKELIRHLFATASMLTEVAHESAVLGQSVALKAADYTDAAEELRRTVQGMLNITGAIATLININCSDRPNS